MPFFLLVDTPLLRSEQQDPLPPGDAALRGRFREKLAAAYAELSHRGPLEQRLFKVHRDAVAPRESGPETAFVSLSEVVGSADTP